MLAKRVRPVHHLDREKLRFLDTVRAMPVGTVSCPDALRAGAGKALRAKVNGRSADDASLRLRKGEAVPSDLLDHART